MTLKTSLFKSNLKNLLTANPDIGLDVNTFCENLGDEIEALIKSATVAATVACSTCTPKTATGDPLAGTGGLS